jgi:hypothetical protein
VTRLETVAKEYQQKAGIAIRISVLLTTTGDHFHFTTIVPEEKWYMPHN